MAGKLAPAFLAAWILWAAGRGSFNPEPTNHPPPSRNSIRRTYPYQAPRDKRGRIKRNMAVRQRFRKLTGFPRGRPGYVVDHIVPLACGGADHASNLQWLTRAQARIKDRAALRACR